jgi:hypothetical protein
LHYSINGEPVETVGMTEIATDRFQANLPPLYCEDDVSFYVSADEVLTGTYFDTDPSEPHMPPIASTRVVMFEDDFEEDQGWMVLGTAIEGEWERCVPAIINNVDCPLADYDGSGHCFVTGSEIFEDVDYGYTMLTSPVFSLPEGLSRVKYARWFHNRSTYFPLHDSLVVYISSDGGMNWTLVEMVGPVDGAGGWWAEHEFWVDDFVASGAHMRLRFATADLGPDSPLEAALDAVTVTWYDCEYEEPPLCGDVDGSDGVDIDDIVYLIAFIFSGGPPPDPYENGDANCSDAVDIDDVVYLISFIFTGGPEPCSDCP